MADYTASVKVKLQDQFSRSAKAVAKSANRVNRSAVTALNKTKRVGQATVRTFDKVRKSSDKATKSLKKMRSLRMPGGVLGGLASTVAVGAEVRRIATLEERYGRLGIQAEITDEKVAKMRSSLETAARNIKLDPKEMLSGVEQIVEKTGDLDFAIANFQNLGLAMQATGSTGFDIGATLAEFQKMGITDPEVIKRMIDTLILQGKEGAFTLQEFASQSSKLFPSIAAYGFKGEKAIEQLGSIAQVARKSTGSADEATTSINSLLKTLSVKEDELNGDGIKTKNEDGSVRDVTAVVRDLIRQKNGNTGKLNEFLGDEGYKAIKFLIDEYKTKGTFSEYDKYESIKGDGSKLMFDANRATKFSNATYQDLVNKKDEASDFVLKPAMEEANSFLNAAKERLDTFLFAKNLVDLIKAKKEDKTKDEVSSLEKRVINQLNKQQIEIKLKKSPDLKVDKVTTASSNIGIIVEDI